MEKERRVNDRGDFYQVHSSTAATSSASSSPSRSLPVSSESSTAVGVGVNGGPNYIVHHVSKFDTLAGVAIRYGVEVRNSYNVLFFINSVILVITYLLFY